MFDIKNFLLEYERKVPNILLLWLVFLVFIILFVLIINSAFKIKNYYQVDGIVSDSYLNILVPLPMVKEIIEDEFIYLDKEKFQYEVVKLDRNISKIDENYYQNIALKIDLNDKYLLDNNVIKVQFIIEEKTILEYIYNLFKGEI